MINKINTLGVKEVLNVSRVRPSIQNVDIDATIE